MRDDQDLIEVNYTCEWDGHCGFVAPDDKPTTVWDHINDVNGPHKRVVDSDGRVRCAWRGCSEILSQGCLPKHVKSKHLGTEMRICVFCNVFRRARSCRLRL